MKKRWSVALILLGMIMMVWGNQLDAHDIDEMGYVVAIGIDKAEDNYYNFTIQFVKPVEFTQITASGGKKDGEEKPPEEAKSTVSNALTNVVIKSTSFFKAREVAKKTMSKMLELKHTRALVVSKEVAQEGIGWLIEEMVLTRELDPNVFVVIAESEAELFLNNISPELEANPANFYEKILQKGYLPYKPDTQLNTIFNGIASDNADFALPMVGIVSSMDSGEIVPDNEARDDGQADEVDVKAGDSFKFSDNKSNAMGIAFFRGNKMVGQGTGQDALIYQMVRGNLAGNYIEMYEDKEEGGSDNRDNVIAMNIWQDKKSNVSLGWSGEGRPRICVTVPVQGEFLSVGSDIVEGDEIKEVEARLEGELTRQIKEFLESSAREYGADFMGFGPGYKKKFLTIKDFEKQNFRDCYREAEFEVAVKAEIRRVGKVVKEVASDEGSSK